MGKKIEEEKVVCQYIMEALLWNIVEQPNLTLNYADLSERINVNISARDLSSRLALVYHLCTNLGCPSLPVMVLNQKERRPSQWFYRQYEIIHQLDGVNERAIFQKELDNVYSYLEWEKIAKQLNLDEQLIIRLEKRSKQLKEHLRKEMTHAGGDPFPSS